MGRARHAAIQGRQSNAILGSALIGVTLAFMAAVLLPRPAQAEVRVTFINSFYYSDLADMPPDKRESMLSEIRKTFVELGDHFLKPGQILKIEVLKIDRITLPAQTPPAAPSHPKTGTQPRPKTGTQPLHMEIQYALQQDGKTLSRARASLSDIDYLANPVPPEAKKDALVHVKEMLRDWFTESFVASTF